MVIAGQRLEAVIVCIKYIMSYVRLCCAYLFIFSKIVEAAVATSLVYILHPVCVLELLTLLTRKNM